MSNQTRLQDHLQLLEQKHPVLALQLRGIPALKHSYGFCSLPSIEGDGVIFVYRLASLASIEELVVWLAKPNRQVIVIEETHEDVLAFLALKEAKELLNSPTFSCYLHSEMYEELFLKIAWEGIFLSHYFVTAFQQDHNFQKWKKEMEHYLDLTFLIASEYQDHGKKIAANFYRNTSFMAHSRQGSHLKLQGIPAIICGAGPSIASQLELCSQLNQKAVIFAGGALLSVCAQEGLIPHLGALIDPDPPYGRFKNSHLFEVPTLYQMRVSHAIMRLMHGPKILAASSGTYRLEDYFFCALGEAIPVLESGWNVANFMATYAAEMGCDPIILLGMDMSYIAQREYLPGVTELEQKGEQVITTMQGKQALSRKDLLMGGAFFSKLMHCYPQQTFINATAEGLPIEGMRHVSLEEAIDSLPLRYDILGMLHAQRIECAEVACDPALLNRITERLRESFIRTEALLKTMLLKLEKSYLHQKANLSKTYEGLALEESDLEEELIYQVVLQPLWEVWKWVFFREQQKRIYTLEGKTQQVLFFQQVTQEHQELFQQVYRTGG